MDYLNPLTIVTLVNFPIDFFKIFIGPVYLIDNINNQGLIFAYAVTDIKQIIQTLILIFLLKLTDFRIFTGKLINSIKSDYDLLFLKKLSNYFFVISILLFFILMLNSGVYLKWIIDSREAYINNRAGSGLFYALSINFMSVSFFLRCFSATKIRRIIIYFIFYFIFLIPFGSKGLFINFFTFFLIIAFRVNRNILFKIAFPSAIIVIALVLYNFKANLNNYSFEEIANYFDYYINASFYYNDYLSNNYPLYHGKLFLSSFWDYVPRSVYSEKPYVYGILNIVENYYPGGPESGNTPAFGGEVASFADFGIIGVILSSVFDISIIIKAISIIHLFKFKRFFENRFSILDIIILMITFSPSYGIYAPSIYYLILTIFILLLILLFKIINTRKHLIQIH
jgi:hypothetical protein